MTKLRRICLAFARWRERRAYAAQERWQRAGWWLHGIRPDDGTRGLIINSISDFAERLRQARREAESNYFLRPSWRAQGGYTAEPGPRPEPPNSGSGGKPPPADVLARHIIENIKKAGDA